MDSFLSRDNVDMLVEILLDDKPDKTQTDIQQIIQEINVFRNTHLNAHATNIGLLELNQTFIKRMVQHHQPPQPQQQVKYKVEDLKAERMDFFDQQLAQKRVEFESAITLKKPALPEFGDKQMLDIPISNMDALLAQTLAQRNMDIPFVSAKPSNWLSPANTSVKTEKQLKLDITEMSEPFDKEFGKEFGKESASKNISWSPVSTTTEPSIFSRLKQTQKPLTVETQIESLTNRIIELESRLVKLEHI
jgi:polyhydroxyalkanoate synthesis regulator phasin